MDPELSQKLAEQSQKIEAIYVSVEKTRRYFLWSMILTLTAFFLPLIGIIFAVPFLLSTYSGLYEGLL